MGLELLDLLFRLEGRFGIKLERVQYESLFLKHNPPDLTAGELFTFIRGRAPNAGVLDAELDVEALWLMLRETVSDALGIDQDEVTKEAYLVRDLGAG